MNNIHVRVRCLCDDKREIMTPLVRMFDTPEGPLPDPQGCDVFADSSTCRQCRKFLIKYLMCHEYDGSVLDPRGSLPPSADA